MTQRSRQQLELTPSEYIDAKRRERQKLLVELEGRFERAFNHREPWYMWVLWRRNREHRHGLRNEKSEPVACPVPGCDDGHASVGGDGVRVEAGLVDAVEPPPVTLGGTDDVADLQLGGPADLGVPVGAGAVVQLDVPVPGLDHQEDSKP